MPNKIYFASPRLKAPKDVLMINTTSHSGEENSRDLSPFYLGPVRLYKHDGVMLVSQTMENAWQYTKVYKTHLDDDGNPNDYYWVWAQEGWDSKRANRYPMGKGAIPEYSFWDGKKLGYVDARKKIYAPLYANAVEKTEGYKILKDLYKIQDICLWDFDVYDHRKLGMTYQDVINCETRTCGHAFILAMMLQNKRVWE